MNLILFWRRMLGGLGRIDKPSGAVMSIERDGVVSDVARTITPLAIERSGVMVSAARQGDFSPVTREGQFL